jgi:predicted GNAT superfamily acetyltransferase
VRVTANILYKVAKDSEELLSKRETVRGVEDARRLVYTLMTVGYVSITCEVVDDADEVTHFFDRSCGWVETEHAR